MNWFNENRRRKRKKFPKASMNCKSCGKLFEYHSCIKTRKYCSKVCVGIGSRHIKIEKVCKYCSCIYFERAGLKYARCAKCRAINHKNMMQRKYNSDFFI